MSIDASKLASTAHVTFDDEFNSLSLWNGSSGTWSTTFWYDDPNGAGSTLAGNGEQEWYINANYAPTSSVKPWTVANGVLTLTAAPASSSISSLINGYGYTSGEVNTFHSFSQEYGYFEMRAQLPAGQGFWPAFWLLPESGAWPPELDIMEVLGNNPSVLYTTAHTAELGYHTQQAQANVVADTSVGYHTYGLDWEADYVTWYFDGQQIFRVATPADMHQPMYILANLAAGGYWPGSVNPGATGHMNVDYIRAYAAGTDPTGVTQALLQSTPTNAAPTSTAITSSDANVILADGVTSVTLTGTSSQTVTANNAGDTIYSTNNANHLIGGTGDDTFHIGRGGDTVTGGGGNDTFVFDENPWSAYGHITDFNAGDTVDITPFLTRAGYAGSDPVGAGYAKIVNDASGHAQLYLDPSGTGGNSVGWWLAATLDGVSASQVQFSGDHVVFNAAGGSGGSAGGSIGGSIGSTGGSGAPGFPATPVSPSVSTSAAAYVAPDGVTSITLTGTSAQTVTGNNAGDTFISTNSANHLIGGTGDDTFYIGRAGDTVTGGGGHDTFVFNENPWWGGHITDFAAGDVIDFTPTMHRAGYTGSDPVGAGYVKIVDDASGNAHLYLDPSGTAGGIVGWWAAVTLDGVSSSHLQLSGDQILFANPVNAAVSTSAAAYVAPAGVTSITLTGASAQTVTGNDAGDTFTSNDHGNHLIGGTGNDTFYVGRGGDMVTGGGGHDTFVFNENPWSAYGHITDFGADDTIDLSPTLARAGYTGSDPVGAGFVKIASDVAGNAQVYIDPNGAAGANNGWWLAATLDGVNSANLHAHDGWITF